MKIFDGGLDARDKSVYVVVLGSGSINANGFRSAMSKAWRCDDTSRWKCLRKITIIFSRILKIQQKRALYEGSWNFRLDFWVTRMHLILLLLVLCNFILFAAATSSLWLTVCFGCLRKKEPRVRVSPPLSSITGGLSVLKAAWCLSSPWSFKRIGGNSIPSKGAKIYFKFFTGIVATIGASPPPLSSPDGHTINDELLTVSIDGGLGDVFNSGEFLYKNYHRKPGWYLLWFPCFLSYGNSSLDINTHDPIGANNISRGNSANYSGEHDSLIGSDDSSPTNSISSVLSSSDKESQSFNVPSLKIIFPCIWDLEYTRFNTSIFYIFFFWKSLMDDSVEKHNLKASTFKRMSHQVSTDSTSAVVGALSSLPMKRHTIHSDGTTDNQDRELATTLFLKFFPIALCKNASVSHSDHLALVLQLNRATPSMDRPTTGKIKVGFASRSTYFAC
ncbi:hypothetical protein M9H77_16413 [Catharanthus roseus]|uniref:Uncharacterized protein n=1 Tax=Catharanthus roseus TaxID=4058 RepID=A0ACC0B1P1_CATRO|nr:hypothetical protein M9H77_16413 [Catharanthus roseus]